MTAARLGMSRCHRHVDATAATSTRRSGGLVRVLAVVLAAVALGVGVGVVIVRSRGEPGRPNHRSDRARRAVTTPTPSVAVLPQSAEPLGDEVIVWPRVRERNWDVALLDLASNTETPLTKSRLADTAPVITRDRRSIFYFQQTETAQVLRVMGADGDGDREFLDELPEGCVGLRRPAITSEGVLVVLCGAVENPQLDVAERAHPGRPAGPPAGQHRADGRCDGDP